MQQYSDNDFKRILSEYPEEVTKEQFYRLCHVSKRVATYFLEQGFLPCKKLPRKTRKYLIKTTDIITFLKERQNNPTAFVIPSGTARSPVDPAAANSKRHSKDSPVDLATWKAFLTDALADCPDVCSVRNIRMICGYSKETICKWCEESKFVYFIINRAYQIPKKPFISFMATDEFTAIVRKSAIHCELLKEFANA